MKKLLLAAVFVVSTFTAQAQKTDNSPVFFSTEKAESGVTFGFRAGLNFSNMSLKLGNQRPELDSRTAFHVGLVTDIPIVKSLYVQTGFYLQSKGMKYTESEDYYYGYEITGSPLYLQIPVLLSYRCDFSNAVQLQVNFGPYFAYGIGGKLKLESWDEYDSESYSYDFFGGDFLEDMDYNDWKISKFDCGLQVGAGFTFAKHYYLGFAYEFGLVNIFDVGRNHNSGLSDRISMKNRNWMLGIGYTF